MKHLALSDHLRFLTSHFGNVESLEKEKIFGL